MAEITLGADHLKAGRRELARHLLFAVAGEPDLCSQLPIIGKEGAYQPQNGGAEKAVLPTKPQQRRRVGRSEEHTSELQSHLNLVCRLLLEKKKKKRE